MLDEWGSGDYSALMRNERERRYAISVLARLLRIDAENRRFRQRSRIAYNAPVFTGLIDCTGPALLLVAVAGLMYAAGMFTRSANPPNSADSSSVLINLGFSEVRSITFGISEPAPIAGQSSTGEFPQLVNLTGCQSRIFRQWQSPFSRRIFYQ